MVNDTRPLRVLHIIDGLGGGGSERTIWDIVRLSNPEQVSYRVATIVPDNGSYVYAERLRRVGAYRLYDDLRIDEPASAIGSPVNAAEAPYAPAIRRRIPPSLKRPLRPFLHLARSVRNHVRPQYQNHAAPERDDLIKSDPNSVSRWPADKILKYFHLWSQNVIASPAYTTGSQRVLDECLDFQPDIVHGHTFHGFALGLFLKFVTGRQMIYQVPCLFSQLRDDGVGWLPELYEHFHPWVDRFFTAYPAEMLGIGAPSEKLLPLHGAVDLEAVADVRSTREHHRIEIRRALALAEDSQIALSVGRLHPSKGHQYSLDALPSLVRRFPDLHWVLLGAGSEQETVKLEIRAQELGVHEYTHIVGFVDDPLPFYAAADIYLRTPIFEADNLSSYQAMAMGLPVAGFDTVKAQDLISKAGHGVLVPVGDSEALATAVERILSLPDRGRAIGQRGADYCQEHLDLQGVVSMLVSAYVETHQSRLGNNIIELEA